MALFSLKKAQGAETRYMTEKRPYLAHRPTTSISGPVRSTESNQLLILEYQQLVTSAVNQRTKVISYSLSRNILDCDDYESIQGLLKTLDDAKFVHHERLNFEYDNEGKVTSKQLIQIWFSHSQQLKIAQRFVADQVLVIDGTFNTNELRLSLLAAVSITNSGSTFPVAFSYCSSESTESLVFFFECLKRECFADDIPPCRVVIGDQAAGLITAVSIVFPNAILQSCDWHAVQAMLKRSRTSGYKKNQIDILQDLCWIYVKSSTSQELQNNRQQLLDEVRPSEKKYIIETWIPNILSYPASLNGLAHLFLLLVIGTSSQGISNWDIYLPDLQSTTATPLALHQRKKKKIS
ncbi:hypothetical protein EPUS_04295 [Endocarpon pusillum Z07020]|uniref:MULE transposase domain-containing protein n=1 Tax=Endocarpon pusillum (strain Z07020 / HMAS-L-300199) TaxID=1263415 RepID=U1GUT2_ENDPU|nr:uncharacterized protein EPUS_04295 [Endocarpon pusillum Z07020]ERF76218.1 hypothetical protein EPUS_04295 [Endocarpon pusillum Z07020]